VLARAEVMFALAEFIGISLDDLNAARLRLEVHEAMFDAAASLSRRKELETLMAADIDDLADAFKRMARAVERGGEA
jgi:hypothetical protein